MISLACLSSELERKSQVSESPASYDAILVEEDKARSRIGGSVEIMKEG